MLETFSGIICGVSLSNVIQSDVCIRMQRDIDRDIEALFENDVIVNISLGVEESDSCFRYGITICPLTNYDYEHDSCLGWTENIVEDVVTIIKIHTNSTAIIVSLIQDGKTVLEKTY